MFRTLLLLYFFESWCNNDWGSSHGTQSKILLFFLDLNLFQIGYCIGIILIIVVITMFNDNYNISKYDGSIVFRVLLGILILIIIALISSIVLIIGAIVEKKSYLLPWIRYHACFLTLGIIAIIAAAILLKEILILSSLLFLGQ